MWGFKSLLPCQFGAERQGKTAEDKPPEDARWPEEQGRRRAMATQVFKVKNGETPGGPGGISPSGAIEKVREWVQESRQFLHEVRTELSKVTWPTRDDVRATTGIVIITVFFFGVFLWLVDLGVQHAVEYIFKKFNV
jgi:preprotein translocase subunit SecE